MAHHVAALASFISERAYFSAKNMPTVTGLKERLKKTSLPKLKATLDYLNASPPSSGPGWYGHGIDGGYCQRRTARLASLHDKRIAALNAVIGAKLREKEKLVKKKQKLNERKKKKLVPRKHKPKDASKKKKLKAKKPA